MEKLTHRVSDLPVTEGYSLRRVLAEKNWKHRSFFLLPLWDHGSLDPELVVSEYLRPQHEVPLPQCSLAAGCVGEWASSLLILTRTGGGAEGPRGKGWTPPHSSHEHGALVFPGGSGRHAPSPLPKSCT